MEIVYRELSYAVVGAAMEVHKKLGPGYLEKVYHRALAHELTSRQIPFEEHKRLIVHYWSLANSRVVKFLPRVEVVQIDHKT